MREHGPRGRSLVPEAPVPFPAAMTVLSPSGKARVCKTLIPRFDSGQYLQSGDSPKRLQQAGTPIIL